MAFQSALTDGFECTAPLHASRPHVRSAGLLGGAAVDNMGVRQAFKRKDGWVEHTNTLLHGLRLG
jgi:hypothetical protein